MSVRSACFQLHQLNATETVRNVILSPLGRNHKFVSCYRIHIATTKAHDLSCCGEIMLCRFIFVHYILLHVTAQHLWISDLPSWNLVLLSYGCGPFVCSHRIWHSCKQVSVVLAMHELNPPILFAITPDEQRFNVIPTRIFVWTYAKLTKSNQNLPIELQ